MAVLLPEPESPVTTTRRSSVIRFWGPVQCSGAARPARFRCPQTPSASSTPLGVGLPPCLRRAYSRALPPRHTLSPAHSRTRSLRLSGAAALVGGDLVVEALGEGERAV